MEEEWGVAGPFCSSRLHPRQGARGDSAAAGQGVCACVRAHINQRLQWSIPWVRSMVSVTYLQKKVRSIVVGNMATEEGWVDSCW